MDNPITFDSLFIQICELVKWRSKDPNTKVGCILVSPDHRKVRMGWNSMPSKLLETDDRWQRPEKYRRVIHAEESAILNAREDLTGWTAFLSMPPCPSCCRLLIHAGIKRIVYLNEHQNNIQFDYNLSKDMLAEAGIILEQYKGD